MKVAPRNIETFLRQPPTEVRAVLLYGPDAGLARERMTVLAQTVVPSLEDPFLVSELSAEGVKADPAILTEEAAAIAMTGGRRAVLVRDAGDALAGVFERFLSEPVGDALILVTSGELGPRSKLRKAFESAAAGAALPCCLDDSVALERLIDETFRPLGVGIGPEARHYLLDHLGADRAISRSEIEKLALWAGRNGHVDQEDAAALLGDSAASSIDDAIYAMADGNLVALERALEQATESGTAPVVLLRAASNHVLRLRRVKDRVAAGASLQSVVAGLRPQIFFKLQARFSASVDQWSAEALADAMARLMEAEAACKRTGAPDRILCHRTLQQVTALARRQRQGRDARPTGR